MKLMVCSEDILSETDNLCYKGVIFLRWNL